MDSGETVKEKDYVKEDPFPELKGVLLSDAIEAYVDKINLIDKNTFSKDNLEAASYDLRLGDEYHLNGEWYKLTDDKPYLKIPPFSVVGIKTFERLHLPRYIIGRWNLRVGLVYKGLLWAGGPQVDPGYNGRLMCPLHNLSTNEIILRYKDHVVTIDFVKTTPFVPSKSKEFNQKTEGEKLEERIKEPLKSGPGDTLQRLEGISKQWDTKFDELRKETRETERSMSRIVGVLIGLLGLVVAILAALFGIFNIPGFP